MMEDLNKQLTIQPPERGHRPLIAGMVTLYNSEQEVLNRIETYNSQVDKLYVVDNSEKPDEDLIRKIQSTYTNSEYISNGGNQGIAYAVQI